MLEKDIKNYHKGEKIGRQLYSLLEEKDGSELERYPEIKEWLESNPYSREVLKEICDEERLSRLVNEMMMGGGDHAARLVADIEQRQKAKRHRKILWGALSSVAAVIVLIVSIPLVLNDPSSGDLNIMEKQPQVYLQPTLVRGGKTTVLSNRLYEVNEKQQETASELESSELIYNTIIVPSKYVQQVVLADGSRVTLNANSELRCPATFEGESREVYLKGEGYFSVVKSGKPFVVNGDKCQVKVYGTEFNVNLREKDCIEAVLVEGSVGVTANQQEVMIKPNEMITFSMLTGEYVVNTVNTGRYVAWMDGFFRCDSEAISVLLESIANWYGVHIEYNELVLKDVIVSASIKQDNEIDNILKLVANIADVEFLKKEGGVYEVILNK